jgi:hypothetical protein
MGLLKKQPDADVETPQADAPSPVELTPDEPVDAAPDLAPDEEAVVAADGPADVAVAPAGEPAGADALLQMFQDAKHEEEDRSMFVEMAGDVELADLMEDLQTTAAALGIVIARASAAESAEQVAA